MIPVTSTARPAACSREPGCRWNRVAVAWVTATCRDIAAPVPVPAPAPAPGPALPPGRAPATSLPLRPSPLR